MVRETLLRAARRVVHGRPEDTSHLIHYLHPGKTGGTAIKDALRELQRRDAIPAVYEHLHTGRLSQVPVEARYFISVREPVGRFKSAFYSRKRQGKPDHDVPWTPNEAWSFERFEHAVDLAEAISAPGQRGRDAAAAMLSIRHLAHDLSTWFALEGAFLHVRPPIHILRQRHLDSDFAALLELLDVEDPITLQEEGVRAHRNDYEGIPELTPLAVENLNAWYRRDVELYAMCDEWAEANLEKLRASRA